MKRRAKNFPTPSNRNQRRIVLGSRVEVKVWRDDGGEGDEADCILRTHLLGVVVGGIETSSDQYLVAVDRIIFDDTIMGAVGMRDKRGDPFYKPWVWYRYQCSQEELITHWCPAVRALAT